MTPRIQPVDPVALRQLQDTNNNNNNNSSSSKPITTAITNPTMPADVAVVKHLMDQTYEERWSEAMIRHVVEHWHLSAIEQEQLRSLQASLRDLSHHWKNNPLDVVRYLRGPGHFDQVEGKFREMLAWREEYGADTLLETYRPPSKALLWYVPSAILKGYDKDGDPIYLERGGVMDGIGLQRFDRQAIVKHIIWLREIGTRGDWILDYERNMGRPPSQVTIIYDMQGMSSRHLKPGVIPMFRDIVKINQQRYCGLAKRIILLRAPSVFQFVWNIAKHFFPPEGQRLMVFTGPSNYQQVLDKYIDREVLPPCICPKEGKGSAIDCMPQNFNGGILPKNTEANIPNEPWIDEMMNFANVHKNKRNKQQQHQHQQQQHNNNRSLPLSSSSSSPHNNHTMPQHNNTPASAVHATLCLSEYRNVKVMTVPIALKQEVFETVLVR